MPSRKYTSGVVRKYFKGMPEVQMMQTKMAQGDIDISDVGNSNDIINLAPSLAGGIAGPKKKRSVSGVANAIKKKAKEVLAETEEARTAREAREAQLVVLSGVLASAKNLWKGDSQKDKDYKVGAFDYKVGGGKTLQTSTEINYGAVLLCTGSRKYTDYETILRVLKDWQVTANNTGRGVSYVIHGGASGADALVEKACIELKIPTHVYALTSGDWQSIGKSAGMKRNSSMLWDNYNRLQNVYAFFAGEVTPGTGDTLKKAILSGKGGKIPNPEQYNPKSGISTEELLTWAGEWVPSYVPKWQGNSALKGLPEYNEYDLPDEQ